VIDAVELVLAASQLGGDGFSDLPSTPAAGDGGSMRRQ